jgi:phospholipid N-methyltransferase
MKMVRQGKLKSKVRHFRGCLRGRNVALLRGQRQLFMGNNGNGTLTAKASKRPEPVMLFARNFFKHPRMLGWFLPSSRFLVRQVLKRVDWPRAKVVVEYGPGVGSFTAEILRRLPADGTLIAVETNNDFVKYLEQSFDDPRLHLVHRSAEEIDQVLAEYGFSQADYIISGIPFKTVPEQMRSVIVEKTHSVLNPEGLFLVYGFTTTVRPYLERVFGSVVDDFELLNLMPGRMFYCRR